MRCHPKLPTCLLALDLPRQGPLPQSSVPWEPTQLPLRCSDGGRVTETSEAVDRDGKNTAWE